MTNPETGLNLDDFLIEADKPEEVEAARNILVSCFQDEIQAQGGNKPDTEHPLSTRRAPFARLLDLPTD